MDTDVNEEVDMDLLVKEQPDVEEDYREEVNKDVEEQKPDPDKVVEADLAMDPAAATESFIRKRFGLSVEEMEDEEAIQEEAGEDLVENAETVVEDEDTLLGVTPAPEATVVSVTPPAGGETEVVQEGGDTSIANIENDTVVEETPVSTEPETAAEVSSLENLRAIFSREDEESGEESPDVSLNIETPNNDVDIDLEGKAITIEPANDNEEGTTEEPTSEPADEGTDENVPAPETEDDGEKTESETEDTEKAAESWWMI